MGYTKAAYHIWQLHTTPTLSWAQGPGLVQAVGLVGVLCEIILPLVVFHSCCLSAAGSGRVAVSGWLLPPPGREGKGGGRGRGEGGRGRGKRGEERKKGRKKGMRNVVRDAANFICNKSVPQQQIFQEIPQPRVIFLLLLTCSTFNCCCVASFKRTSFSSSFSNSAFTFSTPPGCTVIVHAALYTAGKPLRHL